MRRRFTARRDPQYNAFVNAARQKSARLAVENDQGVFKRLHPGMVMNCIQLFFEIGISIAARY
jgi:hypothetical protein